MIRAPSGLRWSCHSCGACCTGHDLGPVAPEVVAGLERADIRAAWAPAADGFVDPRPDGAYLRQRDGACVFLEPFNLRVEAFAYVTHSNNSSIPHLALQFFELVHYDRQGVVDVVTPVAHAGKGGVVHAALVGGGSGAPVEY